jgi:hypothetical protein
MGVMIHSGVLLHFPHVPSVVVALDSGMFLMIERHFLIANVLLKIAVVAVFQITFGFTCGHGMGGAAACKSAAITVRSDVGFAPYFSSILICQCRRLRGFSPFICPSVVSRQHVAICEHPSWAMHDCDVKT